MAPQENEEDWALRQFLEIQTRAIEEFDASIDKVTDTIIEIKTLHESTIKTLIKIIEIELGGLLLLCGVKAAEIIGLIG